MAASVLYLALVVHRLSAFFAVAQGQQQQGIPVPKWLSDSGKDLFNDVMNDEYAFSDATCEAREKLLKEMAGKGDREAGHYRAKVLIELGTCEFKKENFKKAEQRYASGISEMNVPNEDMLLKEPTSAHIVLMKQAAELMKKNEMTEAAVALRRTRVVLERAVKQILKYVHKQMGQGGQAPPLEKIQEEVPGYGKTGNFLPQILKQIPHHIKTELQQMELVDNYLDGLDKKMAVTATSLKQSRARLDKGKSVSKDGVLLYVKSLITDAVSAAENLLSAQEIEEQVAKALATEADFVEKSLTLVKRGKLGKDCKEDKGMPKTCAGLEKVPDVISNGFGETRLLVVKAGKKQQLEVCSTNANVGILVASKDGVKLTVKGEDAKELEAGKAVVVDFCLEATLEASATVPVLFAQAWHPEYAAVERTTELRLRSKAFGLSEAELKEATKVVNDHAKKSWDKSAKAWRKSSALVDKLRNSAVAEEEEKKAKEKEAEEAKREKEFNEDEERKKGLEELEKKRAEAKKKQEEIEAKKKKRQEILELERAMRDPWLNHPDVKKVEANIEDFKEQRRDANAKLEFDLSTSLTKEISAAERELKKVTKKARKEYKKLEKEGKKPDYYIPQKPVAGGAATAEAKTPEKSAVDVEALKKELEDVKGKKKAATEAEDFKEAKKMKDKQKELEEKLKKAEL